MSATLSYQKMDHEVCDLPREYTPRSFMREKL
nr:MAG TPA: hypothetical protein [Caudoviricetes sp.]